MKRRKGFERHHIIPYHLKDHPIIVESGININGAINMIFLPRYESNHPTKMIHRHFRIGNEHHSAYDKEIEIELYKLSTQARLEKWNPEMMRQKYCNYNIKSVVNLIIEIAIKMSIYCIDSVISKLRTRIVFQNNNERLMGYFIFNDNDGNFCNI